VKALKKAHQKASRQLMGQTMTLASHQNTKGGSIIATFFSSHQKTRRQLMGRTITLSSHL